MKTLTKLTLSVLVAATINTSNSAFANYGIALDSFPTMPSTGLSKFEPKTSNATFPNRFESSFSFKNLIKKSSTKKGK
jgi:hypothetical protein